MDGDIIFTVRELISMMQRSDSDYGAWGLCAWDTHVWFGEDTKERVLKVPLIEVLDCAAEVYPDHGFEDLIFLFGFCSETRQLEWGLTARTRY